MDLRIQPAEYDARAAHLAAHLNEHNLAGAVLFDPDYVLYYCGFAFIPTERPMAFVVSATGERALLVPRLEKEHAASHSTLQRVAHYIEYPGDPHPMEYLKVLLMDMGIEGPLGADTDGYPWMFGYRGPALSAVTGQPVELIRAVIEDQMAVKSPAEIALLYESVRWANLAHTLLQRHTRVGVTETEVSQRACDEATRAMLDAIGPVYRAQSRYHGGAVADYRGQIGRNSAIPHALANNMTFQPGDVLVTGATAPVWGYHCELERTMIVGAPTDEQRHMFDHMVALQDLAIEALKPGIPCSEIDTCVRAYFEKHGLMPYWKHHTGHTIGIRYHEGPFLDTGDHTVIKPGMVFTIEPGLYVPEMGGFRHSDTVLVTEDGAETMTYYPRDLDSLIIPA